MRSSITNGSRDSTSTLNRGLRKTQSRTSHQSSANNINRGKTIIEDVALPSHENMRSHHDLEGLLTEGLSALSKTKFGDRGRSATTTALRSSDIMSTERRNELAERTTNQESHSATLKLSNVGSKGHVLPMATDSLLSALGVINNDKPNLKHDIRYTKIFLQKQGLYNLSIWSHLTEVLNKIIAEQPPNVIDYFEEYSRKVKEERLIIHDSLRDIYIPSPHLENAKNVLFLINAYGVKEDAEEPEVGEEEGAIVSSNQMDLEEAGFYLRQAGIAIPDTQLFTLNISIKKLAEENNLQKPRFWGKVHGTQQDYFIFECELTDEEYERRIEEEEQKEAAEAERIEAERIAAEEEAEKAAEETKMAEEEAKKAEEASKADEEKLSKKSDDSAEENESVEQTEQVDEEEKTVPESRTSTKISHEVTFDLPEEETVREQEEEQEDPLLPPLPPPKKLLKYNIPPLLQPVTKEVIKVPAEKHGSGLNKKVYYVSSNQEIEWIELPKVTPQEISVAREIKVYMTGDLKSKIITYPEFPGTEKNYLRAQIARISAATLVSPLGYYKFGAGGGDDEEEEEEEVGEEGEETGGNKTNFVENPKFQPIPVKDLIDPSLASWVHHSQHILKQGRTDWWNPKKAAAGEEEAEEEQEEEEDEEEGEGEKGGLEGRERGPALLSPLSEDSSVEESPAWSVAKTHDYNNNLTGAVVRSNLWPGAFAFAFGKKTENVYCGWGHKHLPHGFSPAQLPHPEYEYELGPEIMEIQDPTVEVEQAWRAAHKKKPPPAEGEEGEEGEENEEEEEEEDEDDD